jgi:hypothetical protein
MAVQLHSPHHHTHKRLSQVTVLRGHSAMSPHTHMDIRVCARLHTRGHPRGHIAGGGGLHRRPSTAGAGTEPPYIVTRSQGRHCSCDQTIISRHVHIRHAREPLLHTLMCTRTLHRRERSLHTHTQPGDRCRHDPTKEELRCRARSCGG